jgi:molybdopterin-guanine dinucleotide biosynthesis protein A
MDFNEFSGYILAGGKSSRMGSDKAFLEIGNKTFIENAVEILKPICENRLKIVLNSKQNHFIKKLPENIPHIFDIYENRGALGGIHASLKDCKTKFAIILAVDIPFLTQEAMKVLCKTANDSDEVSAVIPKQKDDRLQPLAGIYKVDECLPEIEKLLESKESNSVIFYLTKLPEIKTIPENQFNSENSLLNVNSPTEYKKVSKK